MSQFDTLTAERDRLRAALEEIANEGCGEPDFENGCTSTGIAITALEDYETLDTERFRYKKALKKIIMMFDAEDMRDAAEDALDNKV